MGRIIRYVYVFIIVLFSIFLISCSAKSDESFVSRDAEEAVALDSSLDNHSEQAFSRAVVDDVANDNHKKVIRNAEAGLEAKNADDVYDKINEWVYSSGGYEFSVNISERQGHKYIKAVYKIPPEELNALLSYLPEISKVKHSRTSTEDITNEYYDAQARLENYQSTREKLLEIQQKATTVDDILKVQNELTRITGEIEVLKGRINMWDKQVAESTVSITINEESSPLTSVSQVNWSFSSPAEIITAMKNGFILVSNNIISFVSWVLIIIVSISPIIFGIIVLIIAIKLAKKRRLEKLKNDSTEDKK